MSINDGYNFLNNEAWLVDSLSPGCENPNNCWVEAGYSVGADNVPGHPTYYFWAEKPLPGVYREYRLQNVDPAHFNADMGIELRNFWNGYYRIKIWWPLASGSSEYWSATWMSANRIIIGEELSGANGTAYSPQAYYKWNYWIERDGPWHYQSENGTQFGSNPPFSGWGVDQWPSQSTTGGVFYANCC